jgi:hypothetical protein
MLFGTVAYCSNNYYLVYTQREIGPIVGLLLSTDKLYKSRYQIKVVQIFTIPLPGHWCDHEMACTPVTISHRGGSHSSRHHWQWSTCDSEGPPELST